MKVVNAYEDSGRVVLLQRGEDDRLIRTAQRGEYATFIRRAQFTDALRRQLSASRYTAGMRDEGEWTRVLWTDDFARSRASGRMRRKSGDPPNPFVEAGIDLFEGDVDPVRRWFSDTGAELQKPKRAYFDLETDSRVPFSRKEEMRILSWALEDDHGNRWSGVLWEDTHAAEKELIEEFFHLAEPYDQLMAWGGEDFDFDVIKARAQARNVRVDPRRWLWLCQLQLFKRMNVAAESGDEKTSMKLDSVANNLLGIGKDAFDASKTWEAWAAGGESRERLVRYNVQDTALLPRIEAKTGFIDLLFAISEVCRTFPDTRGINPTQQMDGYMLRLGQERGYHFPTRRYSEVAPEKFGGAYVMDPVTDGIMRNVHVADFASLYPSIILSWNMSPDTKKIGGATTGNEKWCEAATGQKFDTTKEGILPVALRELGKLRKVWNEAKAALPPGTPEWKDADRKSTAYKVAANSFYGVLGTIFSRYYDKNLAEAVTQTGVWLIKETNKAAEDRGMKVVYADTDSCFVANATQTEFEQFVAWCNKELYPGLLQERGCTSNDIKLAYEKAFSILVMSGKKRYCTPPEAPIWMGDLSFKPIGEIEIGDEVVGWKNVRRDGVSSGRRRLCKTTVVAIHRHAAPIVKLTMASGRTLRCTRDHRWLHAGRGLDCKSQYVMPKIGRRLAHVIDEPRVLTNDEKFVAAWLGGIFDGEGSLAGQSRANIVISQSRRVNPEVCARLETTLRTLGFSYHVHDQNEGACQIFALHGYAQDRFNFIRWCQPAKAAKIAPSILCSRFAQSDAIERIESDGIGEVIGLTTETGNYVAWGYASKNCGKYLHYKGKAATAESKPEIKGLEFKRGDTVLLARRMQAEVIDMLMAGNERVADYRALIERWTERILRDPLTADDIVLSQALSKPLKEYVKVKVDGTDLAHVLVAKELARRGQQVTEGTRIAYFVADGAESPMKVCPIADYAEDNPPDRFYLWENKVYPATERLLLAAFPTQEWASFGKVRPQKPRADRRALPGQLGLSIPPTGKGLPVAGHELYVVRLDEETYGGEVLELVKAVLGRHPGPRQVVVEIALESGEVAVLDTKLRVSGSEALQLEIFLVGELARGQVRAWRLACVGL